MSVRIRKSSLAEEDLIDIWRNIAVHNPPLRIGCSISLSTAGDNYRNIRIPEWLVATSLLAFGISL
jgi:hypothetical protein